MTAALNDRRHLGDPGFAMQADAAFAAEVITDDERRELLSLDAFVSKRRGRAMTPPATPRAVTPVAAAVKLAEPSSDRSLDDIGNAARFVEQHVERLRYVPSFGNWLYFDGRRLADDERLQHRRRAKATARSLAAEAAREDDHERRKNLLAHAHRSAAEPRLRAMLAVAESDPQIVATPADLDRDPWLLNCENGVLDLRSGELRPHGIGQLLTRLCGAPYFPDAVAPRWEAHLRRCLVRDELIRFLQRLVGLAAIGETLEHILTILYGSGANGKTVTTNAISGALGDYAAAGTLDLLMQSGRNPGRATPELAELRGRRLVIVSESQEDGVLASERVKAITGGDPITARKLYGHPFTFQPSHSVWLQTNHKPRIADDGNAIWRRIIPFPFTQTIPEPEQDRQLGAKLAAERPGILAWIVAGARGYLRDGLDEPDQIREAADEYRAAEDVFGGFLEERTVIEAGVSVQASALLKAYDAWARHSGAPDLSRNTLAEKLTARGFERKRESSGVRWQGLRLLHTETLDDDWGV